MKRVLREAKGDRGPKIRDQNHVRMKQRLLPIVKEPSRYKEGRGPCRVPALSLMTKEPEEAMDW